VHEHVCRRATPASNELYQHDLICMTTPRTEYHMSLSTTHDSTHTRVRGTRHGPVNLLFY